MKKGQLTMTQLLKRNMEELLNDKQKIEKIEKRIDDRLMKSTK